MDNQAKPDSLSSECSSVGGAVPTSPPRHTDECPSQTFEGASTPGVTLDPTTCVCHRAAPTSTPLDALRAERLDDLRTIARFAMTYGDDDVENAGIRLMLALDHPELLAASPASALVTGEKR
jgi:hypothetical protein